MDPLAEHASGMLWALRFTHGRAETLREPGLDPADEHGWVWAHFPLADVRSQTFLTRLPEIPPDALELILSRETRIQMHHEGGWAYGVIPDLERNLSGDAIGPGRLRFALDGRRLITIRASALRIIDDIRRRAMSGGVIETPTEAFEQLTSHYVDLMQRRAEVLADELDIMEDRVLLGENLPDTQRLGPVRRELSVQRREFISLRGAVSRAMSARDGRRVSILIEPLTTLAPEIDDLDREVTGLQERARLLHEEIDTRIASAANINMRALTIMSTLLIPPTVIVGAFGMNLDGIPFAHSRAGFVLASGVCLVTVAAAWWLLKRLKVL